MKIKLFLTVAVFLLGWVIAEVTGALEGDSIPSSEPVGFTAHGTQISYGTNGFVPFTIVKMIAVRSDGSHYLSQTNINHRTNQEHTMLAISLKELDTRVQVFPGAEVATSFESFAPLSRCTQSMLQAPEGGEFMGLRVLEIGGTQADTEQTRASRILIAPELNCLPVYSEHKRIDSEGNVVSTSIYRVNQVTFGEPDGGFFYVPEHYERVEPSEAFRRSFEAVGLDDDAVQRTIDSLSDDLAEADARYVEDSLN